MQLPCSFSLRAFAHAISLHGMPLIHLPSPKLIEACLSSLLCEDFPDFLSEYHKASQQPDI